MSVKQKIIKPFEGFQEKFVRSNLDLVIGGGSMGGGSSSGSDVKPPVEDEKEESFYLQLVMPVRSR